MVLGTWVDERGDLLTLWNRGYQYQRPTAIAINRAGGGHVVELGPREANVEQLLPAGWILAGRGIHGQVRVNNDGTETAIASPRREFSGALPGDVVIRGGNGSRWLYRPSSNATYSLEGLLRQQRGEPSVVVTPTGDVVTLVQRGTTTQVARLHADNWNYTLLDRTSGPSSGDLVSIGDVLVADTSYHRAPLGDGEEDPLHVIAVSIDGGKHWHTARAPLDEHVVLSLTAVADGTTFVTVGDPATPDCSLLRMEPRGPVTCLPVPNAGQAFSHGRRVYVSTHPSRHRYRLLESDDDGTTWHGVRVPGRS